MPDGVNLADGDMLTGRLLRARQLVWQRHAMRKSNVSYSPTNYDFGLAGVS